MNNSKLLNFFTGAVVVITVIQGLIPSMSTLLSASATITLSAILMFLVSALTAWKQALSNSISNASLWPTIIIAIIATLGGINQLVGAITIPPLAGQWIRFAVTAITAILNLASQVFWPKTPASSTSN